MNAKILNVIFAIGAVLILVSSVLVMENVVWGKYSFAIGVAFFIISRMKMAYTGSDFRLKRLNRFYFFSAMFLVIASTLQFRSNSSWVVFLLMVAIMEFYTSVRASVYEKSNLDAAKKSSADSIENSTSSTDKSI